MAAPNLFRILLDALLRPARFATFLGGGRRNIAWAALAMFGALLATFSFMEFVLAQWIPFGAGELAVGLVYALLLSLMIAGLWIIVGSDLTVSPLANSLFWIMRCLIAIAPTLAPVMALAFSDSFLQVPQSPAPALLLLLVGVWLGGALTVVLVRHPQRAESAPVRRLIAAGALAIGAVLWWSPVLRVLNAPLLAPACAGLAAGLLRPFSYLWEAPLSAALALAPRFGVPACRALALHPAGYDDLCLLPLPGLSSLLARAFADDSDEGGAWLLRVAGHLGQGDAARHAIAQIIRRCQLAHPLLSWLSASTEGAALLRDIAERSWLPHPLIGAYAALANTTTPEAWPDVIARQHEVIARWVDLPGGAAMLGLLETGAGVLCADRWPAAIAGVHSPPTPRAAEDDSIWVALDMVSVWANNCLLKPATDRAAALRALWAELPDMEGWPAALIAAMGEHLLFLLGVEQRRGLAGLMRTAHVIAELTMQATAMPGGAPRRPLDYDTLRIVIEAVADAEGGYFQATMHQLGAVELGGPFRQREPFRFADVQALRRSYEQQIRTMHELALAGVPVPPPDLQRLIDLGRRVAAVLPETARQGIVATFQRAQRQRRGLHITLEVAADEESKQLLGIPWELMVLPVTRGAQVDTGGEGFLLLNADVTLVRQVRGIGRNTTPDLTRPLNLQALAAAPLDGAPIDIDATRTALAQLFPGDTADRYWYDGPGTLQALQERLRESNPQILHLLCHGELSDTGRGVRSDLLFTHADGYVQRVSAFDLAPVLTLVPDLQLVVLQACYAGVPPQTTGGEPERLAVESVALALVRQGVPAVVAMQGAVGQAAAAEFVRACYQALAQGRSLEAAIAIGRIAMRTAGALVDWSLPVLYQGSGLPERATWYTRLADGLDATLRAPALRRSLRGGMMALALVLLTAGVLRWLMLPRSSVPNLGALATPLQAWALLGLAGPAVVAAAQRGVRDRDDLPAVVRRAALLAQWMGAYLGYALGGVAGLVVLLLLWVVGALQLVPPAGALLLTGAAMLGGLFASYAAARALVRSAVAIGSFGPQLFGPSSLGLALVAALAISAAPLGVLLLPETPLAFLLDPAPAAIALAILLITTAVVTNSNQR